jgi:hypothetical protein
MSYHLARVGIDGLIEGREHTSTYDLTPDGQRVAVFYADVQDRLLRPLIGADQPQHQPSYALTTTTEPCTPIPTTLFSDRQAENSRHFHESLSPS